MVLLLQHVHVEVIQEVVPVIIHPAFIQLSSRGESTQAVRPAPPLSHPKSSSVLLEGLKTQIFDGWRQAMEPGKLLLTWISGRATSREMFWLPSLVSRATASSLFWISTPLIFKDKKFYFIQTSSLVLREQKR